MNELLATASCTPQAPSLSAPPAHRFPHLQTFMPLHNHFPWPKPPVPMVPVVVQVMDNLQDGESSWSPRCKEKLCPVSDSAVKIRALQESGRTSAYPVALCPSPPEAKSHTAVLPAPWQSQVSSRTCHRRDTPASSPGLSLGVSLMCMYSSV